MPRNIHANVLAQMDAANKRPVLLFEIGLSSTLRFAAYKTNVVFPTAGNTYVAKAITISGVSQVLEGQIGRVTIQLDNVTRDMAAYVNNENFRGKSLVIKRVYLDALGSADYYNEVFNGHMETPSKISRHWLTVSATSGKPLSKKMLRSAYQKLCPWIFGGTECNTDGNADLTSLTASGTADSGTTAKLVDSALTQADDYWNSGNIILVKGGVTYHRTVKNFVAASDEIEFNVELPVAVDNTTTYTVYKGCDKTLDACTAINAWGPSADNSLNFGGCLHIVKPVYTGDDAATPAPAPTTTPAQTRDDFDAVNTSAAQSTSAAQTRDEIDGTGTNTDDGWRP